LETAIVNELDNFWNTAAERAEAQEPCSGDPMCADSTVVAKTSETACYQPSYGTLPELPDDLASIDDAFVERVRALASFI
jgi:hypothetical protein